MIKKGATFASFKKEALKNKKVKFIYDGLAIEFELKQKMMAVRKAAYKPTDADVEPSKDFRGQHIWLRCTWNFIHINFMLNIWDPALDELRAWFHNSPPLHKSAIIPSKNNSNIPQGPPCSHSKHYLPSLTMANGIPVKALVRIPISRRRYTLFGRS